MKKGLPKNLFFIIIKKTKIKLIHKILYLKINKFLLLKSPTVPSKILYTRDTRKNQLSVSPTLNQLTPPEQSIQYPTLFLNDQFHPLPPSLSLAPKPRLQISRIHYRKSVARVSRFLLAPRAPPPLITSLFFLIKSSDGAFEAPPLPPEIRVEICKLAERRLVVRASEPQQVAPTPGARVPHTCMYVPIYLYREREGKPPLLWCAGAS